MVLDVLPYGSELFAAIIILVSVVAAKVVTFALRRSIGRLTRKTESTLDDILFIAISRPVFVGIILGGIYAALPFLIILVPFTTEINMGFSILFTLFSLWFAMRVVNGLLNWYATEVSVKTKTKKDDQFLPIIRKVVLGIFAFVAFLMILGQFGIEITTLVAALGIGGLAVALALQPTLANFFSGAYIVMDRVVRIGDFIELDGATKGTVIDINWRSTKIKTYTNNVLVVPNTKLADSIITAYSQPNMEVGFSVPCGVGYGEDLEKVEKAAVDVATKVLKTTEGGLKDFKPFVRFKEFGDSNINFSVILRSKDRGSSFRVKHEFIKALKARFDKDGIEIAWPVRKVYYGDPEVLNSYRGEKRNL